MSSHATKSIVQKVTPFLGVTLMVCASFLRQKFLGFSDIAALVLCLICGIICISQKQHPLKRVSSLSVSSRIFMIGSLYALFMQTSVSLCTASPLNQIHTDCLSYASLGLLFILTWALLIQRAERIFGDPVICYGYWPTSALWRLPALLSYYASSNGLFIAILCCFCFFLFDHVLSWDAFEKLDVVWILLYITSLHSLLWWICKRKFSPKRPFIGLKSLLSLWCLHFLFMSYGYHLPPLSWTFSTYKNTVLLATAGMMHSLESPACTLPLSMTIFWGVFWGSALSASIQWRFQDFFILALGYSASLIAMHCAGEGFLFIGYGLFFGLILWNALRSKTPIHMIDCPWRTSPRLPLKPLRWLISMGMSPWIFCMVSSLSNKGAVFFILQNFSLLVILGLMYPVGYEIFYRIVELQNYLATTIRDGRKPLVISGA